MSLIRQEEVYPAVDTPWAQAIACRAGAGGVAKNDLVIINSVAATGSKVPKAVKADADGALAFAGIIYVAAGAADANGEFFALPWRVITGVDTSAATAAGYPVYLSATAGEWTATKPSGADDAIVAVGTVLVKDASAGVVMLAPAVGSAQGFVKRGTAQIVDTDTSVVVALGASFANGVAVASIKALSGSSASNYIKVVAINGSGNLTINVDTAPGAGETTDVSFIASMAAI